jgi:hypothetical protein
VNQQRGDGVALRGLRISVPSTVVHRSFDAETVLLNLTSGTYHGLNPTGGRMFDLLAETGSFDATVAALVEEYGQPEDVIARDLDQLCRDLEKRGLIEVDGSLS